MPPRPPAIKNPGKHHKWMALGMLRGLRTQLPKIAEDPFRQTWIAPWISDQLGVECKAVRTWFALYHNQGGDANAIVAGQWLMEHLSQQPVSGPAAETAVGEDVGAQPPADAGLERSERPSGKKKTGKLFDPLAASREIRWQAVGMARALDAHLPLIAKMWGFDEVIASELQCRPKSVKAWLAEYRQTGTVDQGTVPPAATSSLEQRIKGPQKWKTGGVYGR